MKSVPPPIECILIILISVGFIIAFWLLNHLDSFENKKKNLSMTTNDNQVKFK